MPLKMLNTFARDWRIKVKLLRKYPLRPYSNAGGSGNILNIDLADRTQT